MPNKLSPSGSWAATGGVRIENPLKRDFPGQNSVFPVLFFYLISYTSPELGGPPARRSAPPGGKGIYTLHYGIDQAFPLLLINYSYKIDKDRRIIKYEMKGKTVIDG